MLINTEQIKAYKQYQRIIDEATEQLNAIKKDIIKIMEAEKLTEIIQDEYKIKYIEVISERLNTKALKEGAPGVYEQYKQESKSHRFIIN